MGGTLGSTLQKANGRMVWVWVVFSPGPHSPGMAVSLPDGVHVCASVQSSVGGSVQKMEGLSIK